MTPPSAFFRESGTEPAVVCLGRGTCLRRNSACWPSICMARARARHRRPTVSSRAVIERLAGAVRNVEAVELDGLGHMAPVTHPDIVNARIAQFLEQRGR
jgi:pimeloyl-ACP methyl ester carboxylesterase